MEITKEIAFNSKNYHYFGIAFGSKSLEAGKRSSSKKPENLVKSYIDGAYYYRNFYKQLSEEELNKIDSLPPNYEYMEKVKEILKPKLSSSKTKKLSQIQKNTLYKNILEQNKTYLISYKVENRNEKLQAVIDTIYNLS